MRAPFDDSRFRALVILYGFHQLGHLLLNFQYFFWPVVDFPPPPTTTGQWGPNIRDYFNAVGVVDSITLVLGLVFVAGYFYRRGWSMWVGLVALSGYMSSMALFTYVCYANGAWNRGNVPEQLVVYVTFIPAIALCVWMCRLFHQSADAMFGPAAR